MKIKILILYVFIDYCSLEFFDSKIKILPLGDSITEGYGSCQNFKNPCLGSGYRNKLSNLIGANYSFVGSQTDVNGLSHEGHPGYFIKGHENNNTFGQGIFENIEKWLETSNPEIILLHIGTNTLAASYMTLNADEIAINELSELIDLIFLKDRNIKIYLMSIIGLDLSKDTNPILFHFQETVKNYNLKFGMLINKKIGLENNIKYLDLYNSIGLSPENYLDLAHPNFSGYEKMAESIKVLFK